MISEAVKRQGDAGEASQHSISAATGVGNKSRRVLKREDSFVVVDEFGHIQAAGPAAEGLFYEDTRFLSHLSLTIGGLPPLLLSSAVCEANTTLSVDLTNAALSDGGYTRLAASSVHVLNSMILGPDALFATLSIRNFAMVSAEFELAIELEADFADMFEVRGAVRERRGQSLPTRVTARGQTFTYHGLDRVTRWARVEFEPAPAQSAPGHVAWAIVLPPGGKSEIRLTVRCEREGRHDDRLSRGKVLARDRQWEGERRTHIASVTSGNATLNDWLRCSRADIDMLATRTPQGLYPYAGVPWYSTAFGRDGLLTAFQCLWLDPELAAGTLCFLGANQATEVDPKVDAEPGKILHETRLGEMAALGEVPFGRYFGSIDSTPLFVMLAAAYFARTGDLALIRSLWPHIEAALEWMTRYGDLDGDGFIEYRRKSADGLENQGWKDSSDAIFREDGALADAPIALVEVQAYAFAAYGGAATLAAALGHGKRAEELRAAARHSAGTLRGGILARRSRHLRDRARRCEAAVPGALVECRARAARRHCRVRPRIADGRDPDGAIVVFRLGHPHDRRRAAALQPDVVPRRLGMAARQYPDRNGFFPLWLQTGSAGGSPGVVRGGTVLRVEAHAGIVLRLCAAVRYGADLVPAGMRAASLVRGLGVRPAGGCAGDFVCAAGRANPFFPSGPPGVARRTHALQSAAWRCLGGPRRAPQARRGGRRLGRNPAQRGAGRDRGFVKGAAAALE